MEFIRPNVGILEKNLGSERCLFAKDLSKELLGAQYSSIALVSSLAELGDKLKTIDFLVANTPSNTPEKKELNMILAELERRDSLHLIMYGFDQKEIPLGIFFKEGVTHMKENDAKNTYSLLFDDTDICMRLMRDLKKQSDDSK